MVVNDNKDKIVSLTIPSGWARPSPDPGYVYFASPSQRKRITFYVRPAKEDEFPEKRCQIAVNRLRRLCRDVDRNGTSCLRDISKGPKLRLASGTRNAGWMYRVIKPNTSGGGRDIRYWTIVTRDGKLDYYLELRWEPDLSEEKDDHLSLMQKFCKAFEPICDTFRIEHDADPLPVVILVQQTTQ